MAVINSARFDLRGAVNDILHTYAQTYAPEELFEACDEVSKEAVRKLKAASKSAYPASTKYHAGWTRTVEKGRLTRSYIIHGKTADTWALAHLLENGHAKRGGGRVSGRSHIAEVNEWANTEAYDRVIDKLVGEAW